MTTLDADGIRAMLSWDYLNDVHSEYSAAQFDRWLAEHDRAVAEATAKQALEDAAAAMSKRSGLDQELVSSIEFLRALAAATPTDTRQERAMRLIDNQIVQAAIHSAGSCAGCREGGCFGGFHCPCEGCDCPSTDKKED